MKESVKNGAACMALIALLAASGYAGAKQSEPVRAVSVPIVFDVLEESAVVSRSAEDAGIRLEEERKRSLALLEEVIGHARASGEAVQRALEQKTRIAAGMECEARLVKALEMLGIHDAKAVSGENVMSVFVCANAAHDDKTRMQIVDAAVGVTGLSAENIKIILAKNE